MLAATPVHASAAVGRGESLAQQIPCVVAPKWMQPIQALPVGSNQQPVPNVALLGSRRAAFARRGWRGRSAADAPRAWMPLTLSCPNDPAMSTSTTRHFLQLPDLTPEEVRRVLELGRRIKAAPHEYAEALKNRVLLMIFAKPSLRTRVSFEAGMAQMGGHAIYYDLGNSPLGAGKESIADTARASTRMVDAVMARLFEHEEIEEFAAHSSVPVVNGLTNYTHPCQILADLMTVAEKKGTLEGLTLCYTGDAQNNVTHSLLYGCAMLGVNIRVACPSGAEYEPLPKVVARAKEYAAKHGSEVTVSHDAKAAAQKADVIYTDSWMSYHIPKDEAQARRQLFLPYQVNAELMQQAKPDAVFMNCLPAERGAEQTAEVIDGPNSIVFDQAENRLHAQKGLLVFLLAGG